MTTGNNTKATLLPASSNYSSVTGGLRTPPNDIGPVGSCVMSPQLGGMPHPNTSNQPCADVPLFPERDYGYRNRKKDPAGAQRPRRCQAKKSKSKKKLRRNEKKNLVKPPYSYISLIAMAIERSPNKMCTHNEICQFIINTYPFYRTHQQKLKKAITHRLRFSNSFVKIARAINGKDCFSILHPDSSNMFENAYHMRRRNHFKCSKNKAIRQCQVTQKGSRHSSLSKPSQKQSRASAKHGANKALQGINILPPKMETYLQMPTQNYQQMFPTSSAIFYQSSDNLPPPYLTRQKNHMDCFEQAQFMYPALHHPETCPITTFANYYQSSDNLPPSYLSRQKNRMDGFEHKQFMYPALHHPETRPITTFANSCQSSDNLPPPYHSRQKNRVGCFAQEQLMNSALHHPDTIPMTTFANSYQSPGILPPPNLSRKKNRMDCFAQEQFMYPALRHPQTSPMTTFANSYQSSGILPPPDLSRQRNRMDCFQQGQFMYPALQHLETRPITTFANSYQSSDNIPLPGLSRKRDRMELPIRARAFYVLGSPTSRDKPDDERGHIKYRPICYFPG